MCKKDTDGGSYCCCKCCTPTVSSIVVAIVGAAILVASFVIAAVVLTMLQDGIVKTARYNSPRSDAKAFNDWLSNIPSKRSTNDASLKYYQYYFFNITNLDAVVNNSAKGLATEDPVYPLVDEIGPYTYRYYVDRLSPTFDTDDERLTYSEYYRYIFEPTLSKMGSRQLDDQTDVFTTTSLIYSSIFGNPLTNSTFANPELVGRIGLASVLGFPHIDWLNQMGASTFGGYLFDPTESRFAALGCPGTTAAGAANCMGALTIWQHLYGQSFKGTNYNNTAVVFATWGAQLFGVSNNRWASAVPVEYWWYIDTFGTPIQKVASPFQAIGFYNGTLMTSPALPQCNFAFGVVGAAGCWLQVDANTITALLQPRVGITIDQVNGIKSYYQYLAFAYWNFVFASNGHLGSQYKSLFSPANCAVQAGQYISPLVKGEFGCTTFNNANMYIKATPRSLLFEQYNTIGAVVQATKPASRRGSLSFSTNYTSEADARLDSWQYTVGTGINHINDIDNLYLWKNKTSLSTDPWKGIWCHKGDDATYAPGGYYPVQHFSLVPGWTYREANQAQMTKYTPNYPPGKVSDSNRYSFENSIISDKTFALDLFVGDISRHAKMVYYRDASVKGIDIQRYTISDTEFNAGLTFFGQYFRGLANYSCPGAGGPNTFSCYPRYGKLDLSVLRSAVGAGFTLPSLAAPGSVLYTTGIDTAVINAPDRDTFLANSQMGENFGDSNELIAMIDLEPVSGAALGGTLKQQVNLLVQPYIGANLLVYLNSTGVTANPAFPSLFRSAAPNAHLHRATLMPIYWLNKIGFLSDKQADTFKSSVYGAKLASRVVLIVGSIVGGLMMFVALGFVIVKRRAGYNTQTSKSDLAL